MLNFFVVLGWRQYVTVSVQLLVVEMDQAVPITTKITMEMLPNYLQDIYREGATGFRQIAILNFVPIKLKVNNAKILLFTSWRNLFDFDSK